MELNKMYPPPYPWKEVEDAARYAVHGNNPNMELNEEQAIHEQALSELELLKFNLGYLKGKSETLLQCKKLIEDEGIVMKETHACRFNDGKQNCECYFSALEAIKSKLDNL